MKRIRYSNGVELWKYTNYQYLVLDKFCRYCKYFDDYNMASIEFNKYVKELKNENNL